ncbi:polyphosphate kinase 1 [Leadbettera azotonutricia]|uniref:Polyphosphate kinase n=1 Tax=Leadbettera azotonutricia (strain ATCC BAA-888 / DSM 13862 / ZAS-9) TaxID=545695 RepID=F5YFF0_LEAAZ|nr:polyphosphate kinase 1 [Leadbettera azotonutricia]AEF81419.1 polyphosphate kinase [Leadbettera azotonutricia ZAS-9]
MEAARFFSRDLSWIDFNTRVLEEGLRQDLLPLERFKYFSIVSSNFDEFFMVRVAALKRAEKAGSRPDPSGLSPGEQLKIVSEKVRVIIQRQYSALKAEVFPSLAKGGLYLVRPSDWNDTQKSYLDSLFQREILPLLTPLRVEDGESLPAIDSLWLHAAFLLEGDDGDEKISIIRIPPVLERIVWLPEDAASPGEGIGGKASWALLEDLVLSWGSSLYPGFQVKESFLFKINRDADFSVDEKRDEDFIEAMEEVLEGRERSMAVRMVFSPGSMRLKDYFAKRLNLLEQDLYEIDGPINLGSLYDLVLVRGFDKLREKPWKIYAPAAFPEDASIWDRIKAGDVVLHFPYQSFDPVVRFFLDAAQDPQVISIKTALYRTSGNSPIVRALEQASLAGKHVTAVVELKARFDEERNISWANRLEKAGVIVVYGLARLKVHAKVSVVMRRENERIRRYVHLSTGNYNDKTARFYEDICLFSAREDLAYDAGLLFNMITGYSEAQGMRKLVIAPLGLKRKLVDLIDREIRRSSPEAPGRIMAKMNALADTDIINALYRASQAGVKVLLNVRGICMLIPGVQDLSENIRVVSVIDHYLEHSRIVYFANGGADELYLSSADWMPRNLERRVELMFPVLQDDSKRLVHRILEGYFKDNCQAWELCSDSKWTRLKPIPGDEPFRVQAGLLALAANQAEQTGDAHDEFIVRRSQPNLEGK